MRTTSTTTPMTTASAATWTSTVTSLLESSVARRKEPNRSVPAKKATRVHSSVAWFRMPLTLLRSLARDFENLLGMRLAVLPAVLLLALLAPPAAAKEVVVYVCGKDLCRVAPDGRQKQRLTHGGSYSRPSISRSGRRLAFRKGARVYTARVGEKRLKGVRRIGPAPGGPADATQFDVALSRDGKRVAWVEQRVNVVFGTIDYRRYAAAFDGSGAEQVAASGGRPFVAFYDARRILREGLADSVEGRPDATTVDQGLCVPDPESAQNGTCGDHGPQAAFDPQARHLRHPHVSPDGKRLVATAYRSGDQIDDAVERPGQLLLFDTATALPLRELTTGASDRYPSFSPNGRKVIFERARSVRVVPAAGGRAKRLVKGTQPTWGR
jgi:hypothetical protein